MYRRPLLSATSVSSSSTQKRRRSHTSVELQVHAYDASTNSEDCVQSEASTAGSHRLSSLGIHSVEAGLL